MLTGIRTQALERCATRRFSTYWTEHGVISDRAKQLISLRDATAIPISGADAFFEDLQSKVESLDSAGAGHPLSKVIAVETVKRLLSEERHKIALRDFLVREARYLVERRKGIESNPIASLDRAEFERRLNQYTHATENLVGCFAQMGRWATGDQLSYMCEVIRLVGSRPEFITSTKEEWLQLGLYPCLLLSYSAGIAAVHVGNWIGIRQLWMTPIVELNKEQPSLDALHPEEILSSRTYNLVFGENKRAPVSDLLFGALKENFQETIPLERDFESAFDRFELMWCLEQLHNGEWTHFRPGRYWGTFRSQLKVAQLDDIRREATTANPIWPPLSAGLFNGTPENLLKVADTLVEQLKRERRGY